MPEDDIVTQRQHSSTMRSWAALRRVRLSLALALVFGGAGASALEPDAPEVEPPTAGPTETVAPAETTAPVGTVTPAEPDVTIDTSLPQPTVRLVRRNETLMSISREWSATIGVTLPQAMIGIYRANPTAFGPLGMSEMVVGSILTLPDAAALNTISPAAASSEVSRSLRIRLTGEAAPTQLSAPAPGPPTLTTAPAKPTEFTPDSTLTPSGSASGPTAESPVATLPALELAPSAEPATPEVKVARLEADLRAAAAEIGVLKARLAVAAGLSGPPPAVGIGQSGWVAEARRLAAEAWWSTPALLLISLGLLIAFLVSRQSRVEAVELAPRKEMSYDLPPINAAQDADPLMDAPLRTAPDCIAPVAVPSIPVVPAASPINEDREGDPPPVDEAGNKINLARAFIEMRQHDAAILELQAALRLGDETQRVEAIRLLDSLLKS